MRILPRRGGRLLAVGACSLLTLTGCGWHGVNSLPLPGAPGQGPGAKVIQVEMANVGTLVSNSPVLVDDVVVGSVSGIRLDGWHAVVEASIRADAVVPANVVATIGQTSLLGSSHLALNTPAGAAPSGQLASGTRIPLDKSSTYPSTEQTLASLSVVVNGGGLGQLGEIIGNLNEAFSGHQDQIGSLLVRLDTMMGVLDGQRDDIIASIDALNRLAGRFAEQRDVVTETLRRLPPALDVLLAQRPNITAALDRLRTFSDTATAVITDVRTDLLTNLRNLEPTLRALADVGPQIDAALAYATVFPYGQSVIDRAVQGDYLNLFATVDLTVPRLKREMLLGTPWGDPTAVVQAAVGDPGYARQTSDPLGAGIAPPPTGGR
ncbi:MCE family protein [Nocardia exalbida]|uniref:MCE family protein n=1 Tax=Nocardia exalbida TaxID=290231 RepID=UPI0003172913|nr:MCE family protein [Nocardia exalbida]